MGEEREQKGIFEKIIDELKKLIEPIIEAVDDAPIGLVRLFERSTNLAIEGILSEDTRNQLNTIGDSIYSNYGIIMDFAGGENSNLIEVISAIKDISNTLDNIKQLEITTTSDIDAATLGQMFLDYIVTKYLRKYQPKIYWFLNLMGIIEEGDSFTWEPSTINYQALSDIVSGDLNMRSIFERVYGWGADYDSGDRFGGFKPYRILSHLQWLFLYLGVPALFSFVREDDEQLESELKIPLLTYNNIEENQATTTEIGVKILPLVPTSDSINDAGLAVFPFGTGGVSQTISLDNLWSLKLTLQGDVEAYGLDIRPESIDVRDIEENIHLSALLKRKQSSDVPMFTLGNPNGTRFEIGTIGVKLQLDHDIENGLEFSLGFPLEDCRIVIKSSEGDGFIQKILPKNPIILNFPITPMYSTEKGFYLDGGVGFEYTIPIYKTIGPIFINTVDLKFDFLDENIVLVVAVTGGVEIGPITAVVEKIGLITKLELGKPGIFGKADLSFGFKPPTGIGLSIDAGSVSGGGYLRIEPPNYAGILNLSVSDKFAITAIGLLTTELPGGKKGFSLLLSLMAEFASPIQLGYGFALYGVGGIIGINRRMNKDALIEAQKAHLLDHVLFPEDPIRNATSIIDTISNIFPPEEGYYVFGPMVRLFWGGVRHLVDFDVGIFIEFGGDGLVALIGLAHALLPTEENPIVELHMDILGIIDFGNKSLEIRSSLYNSSLLERFTLSGDMALQSNWGDNPDFVLSIGGFHPSFNPPAGFPNLRRVSISFGSDNPRASLSMYLAITTNTFQTGASLDLYAAAGKFSLKAHLGFDTLIQFKPFKFIADIDGNASINLWDEPLLSVGLNATLEGPNRYHIFGCATFTWCRKDFKINFNKYFGDTLPDETRRVNPYNTLKNALEMAKPIYEVPSWANEGVTLVKGAESYLSPVGNIIINQNAVPLDHDLSKFGGRSLRDEWANHFTLDPDFGDADLIRKLEPAPESNFAPAQFFSMNDNEKLASPAFEEYPSGIRIGGIGRPPNSSAETLMEYETFLINSDGETVQESVSLGFISIYEIVLEDVRFQGNMYEAERVISGWEMQGSKQYFEHEVEVNVGPTIKAEKFIVAPDAPCKFTTDDSMGIGDSGELLWEYWQKNLNDSRSGVKELTNFQANEIVNRVGGVVMSSSLSEEIAILEASMTIVRDDRAEFSTMFENYDQKANQLFQLLSSVMKGRKEMRSSTSRNLV